MNFSRTARPNSTQITASRASGTRSLAVRRVLRACLACALAALGASGSGAARAQEAIPVIGLDIAPGVIAENAGERAAVGTMRRYFADNNSPLTVKLANNLPQTLGVPATIVIPSGADRVSFPVSVSDDAELNGTRTALVTASAPGYFDTFFAATISDDESILEMTVSPTRVKENGGRATVTIRRAPSSAKVAEDIIIGANISGALTLPEKVRFESGQTSQSFEAVAIDNDKFDGERVVSITARRDRSVQIISADLALIDDELDLTLSLPATAAATNPPAFAENAEELFATVSRTRAAAERGPILVDIASSDASAMLGTLGVLMARGQTSVRVPLQAIDDLLVDGPQSATLTATASGYNPDSKIISVLDNDKPGLLLSLNTASASESLDIAATGTLRRNTPTTAAVTIALRSSSPRVSVPASVTIARGAVEASFPIRVVDNALRDGNANVSISASAAGFPSRTAQLSVLDNDGPTLQIELSPLQVLEGQRDPRSPASSGIVRRLNSDLSQPLVVTLSSSDANVVLLAPTPPVNAPAPGPSPTPAPLAGKATLTVEIAAGQSSAKFVVLTPENAIPTDLQTATLTASTAGLSAAAVAVDVRDNDDSAELRVAIRTVPPSPKNDRARVFEDAGAGSIVATVSRNTATTSEVIVQIKTSGDIVAPASVVIPFGRSEVSFFVTPLDDDLRCEQDSNVVATLTPIVAGYLFVAESLLQEPIAGYDPKSNEVLVIDNDPQDGCIRPRGVRVIIEPRVKRSPEAIAESDGLNAAKIIVKRSDAWSSSDPEFGLGLVVDLVSSLPERAAPVPGLATNVLAKAPSKSPISPARIILLPGGRSLPQFQDDPEDKLPYILPFGQVPLAAIQNQMLQSCGSITITPRVIGYVRPNDFSRIIPVSEVGQGFPLAEVSDSIDLLDDELELSRLSVSPYVINESGASGVATGLVRRASGLNGALTVTIRTLNHAKIGVSPLGRREPLNTLEVTIPEGQLEASFNVIANDNTVLDGDISALLEASTKCSVGLLRTPILVRDNEVPAPPILSLSILPTAGQARIIEAMPAAGVRGTIRRTGNLSRALMVTLRSSDLSELVVPTTVMIPAGRAAVAFTPRVVDDAILDGPQRVTVTASAIAVGARQAQVTLGVADNEKAAR